MSSEPADAKRSSSSFPTAVWLFAVALLAGEYLLAVFLFDAERLPMSPRSETSWPTANPAT